VISWAVEAIPVVYQGIDASDRRGGLPFPGTKFSPMRLMLGIWTSIIAGGVIYFVVIGLTHH
jgi:hypothetical protein